MLESIFETVKHNSSLPNYITCMVMSDHRSRILISSPSHVSWAAELGLQKIKFETDFKVVTGYFSKPSIGSSDFNVILSKCRAKLSFVPNLTVSLIRRQTNLVNPYSS